MKPIIPYGRHQFPSTGVLAYCITGGIFAFDMSDCHVSFLCVSAMPFDTSSYLYGASWLVYSFFWRFGWLRDQYSMRRVDGVVGGGGVQGLDIRSVINDVPNS